MRNVFSVSLRNIIHILAIVSNATDRSQTRYGVWWAWEGNSGSGHLCRTTVRPCVRMNKRASSASSSSSSSSSNTHTHNIIIQFNFQMSFPSTHLDRTCAAQPDWPAGPERVRSFRGVTNRARVTSATMTTELARAPDFFFSNKSVFFYQTYVCV